MGRKATSLKSKGSNPINLPHDGPVNFALKEPSFADEGIQSALLLVQGLSLEDSPLSQMITELCKALLQAKTDKDQLQALQAFRSTLINAREHQQGFLQSAPTSSRALFRLLLEWSMSCQTSIPLRRAIQSSLNTLETDKREVVQSVIASFWGPHDVWQEPLVSLDVAVSSSFLLPILQQHLMTEVLLFMHQKWVVPTLSGSMDQVEIAAAGLSIVNALKLLIRSPDSVQVPHLEDFQNYVIKLMECPAVPTEGFAILGIVYGTLHFRLQQSSSNVAASALSTVQALDSSSFSEVARVFIVQGITATLKTPQLVEIVDGVCPLEVCSRLTLRYASHSTDPMVRWAAIKGLSTLASHWKDIPTSSNSTLQDNLVDESLQVLLQAWENPPLKKLGTAIPGVFQTIVGFLDEEQRHELCRTVLRQPPTRKGRYLALEILLPHFRLEDLPSSAALLEGVGDRGPNTGPIADLWIKVLELRWVSAEQLSQGSASVSTSQLEDWLSHWVPALGEAVVSGSLSRRKRVTFFCVVRIFDLFRRTKSLQPHLSLALVRLIQNIGDSTSQSLENSGTTHRINERALWALLVLTRYFHDQKGLSPEVKETLSRQIPLAHFQLTLIHASASLRLAGFQAIDSVISQVYGQDIDQEATMWKYALPFSTKVADDKGYTAALLQCLVSFLDRLSSWENSTALQATDTLSKLYNFVVDFLVNDLFVQQCAYPGAIADKEYFGLALLESLISFAVQDPQSVSGNPVARGAIFTRSRSLVEVQTMKSILEAILDQEVIASLFGLLHSIWDNTRVSSFRVLAGIVSVAQRYSIPIPTAFCGDTERTLLKRRALYLASSPRQREADTGSRVIAFLYLSQEGMQERKCMLEDLVDQFETRLAEMKKCLAVFLKSQGSENASAFEDTKLTLPLVHGIIHGIRLTIESETNPSALSGEYGRFIAVCCNAIQLSLNIVADVRDGEMIEGMDEDFLGDKSGNIREGQDTPLNVNTGAIGANGTLSKLTSPEDAARLAIQRIVIGTWLLTKEACAAAAATVSVYDIPSSSVLIDRCGTLLVSTLIALKHTGAAFAAREALQQIATVCFNSSDSEQRNLPVQWTTRLLEELSRPDKVRDSTLRRSMGYGLGFMALMRSEVTTRSSRMCHRILRELVVLSLPPASQMESCFKRLGLNAEKRSGLLLSCFQEDGTTSTCFLSDKQYEPRCRVHALNVLRQLVLDAPLSRVVGDFIGDAIISSLLGYNDASWAVRNSATMVFSSAMLRVVDPDKNATNTDATSSQAITITELFRRYPALPIFLPALMDHCLAVGKEETSSQLFPMLLLLSRIQPVSESGSNVDNFSARFAPMVFDTLDCRDMIVREVASRALANVCSDIDGIASSRISALQRCLAVIRSAWDKKHVEWNKIDGIMLAIRALTTSSICRQKSLNMGIQHTLLQVIEGKNKEFPPTCRATAIEVLMSSDLSPELVERLGRYCQLLCTRSLGGPGAQTLSSQAAISVLRFLESDVWQAKDTECLEKALGDIHKVFCSNTIDVRIASTKAFKKTIYSNIDNVLENNTSGVPAEVALLKLTLTLLSCVQREVDRGANVVNSDGPHIPTLRRLTRCALECAYPIKASMGINEANFCWRIARSMIEIEQFLKESDCDFNGETFLSGNGAELMSLALAGTWPEVSDADVTLFIDVVKRLNDPTASWRTRHSAAIAIENSGILRNCIKSQPLVLAELVSMLQDSDNDVRKCASRAVNQLGAQTAPCLQASATLSSIFPLVFGVPEFATASAKHVVVQNLATFVFTNCQAVVSDAMILQEELNKTRHLSTPAVRSDETNSRRIFEAEDPNPTKEKLLTNQLSVRALFEILPYQSCQEHKHSVVLDIVHSLDGMLRTIEKDVGTGGLIHDFSRHPTLFVGFHGLICCVSALIYLGTIDQSMFGHLQSLSSSILSADSASLHPEILKALSSFSIASNGSTVTKESTLSCLFLVKG
eukprot:Nitzschia sp. Nitz4//scaffold176_size46146//10399//16466//NITZ4_007189-RA/size46146-snap-gene-0.3-mRNA-1//-1//CDS//3329539006//6962//frame0